MGASPHNQSKATVTIPIVGRYDIRPQQAFQIGTYQQRQPWSSTARTRCKSNLDAPLRRDSTSIGQRPRTATPHLGRAGCGERTQRDQRHGPPPRTTCATSEEALIGLGMACRGMPRSTTSPGCTTSAKHVALEALLLRQASIDYTTPARAGRDQEKASGSDMRSLQISGAGTTTAAQPHAGVGRPAAAG